LREDVDDLGNEVADMAEDESDEVDELVPDTSGLIPEEVDGEIQQ